MVPCTQSTKRFLSTSLETICPSDGMHSFSDARHPELILPTTPSTSSKLDEILSLLHNQEARLSSLMSEVYTYGVWLDLEQWWCYFLKVTDIKESMKGKKKSRAPQAFCMFTILGFDTTLTFLFHFVAFD